MKSPDQILDEVRRWWNRGRLLVPPDGFTFPHRIPIPPPDSATIRNRYPDVMDWYRTLDQHERDISRPGYRIEWRETEFRGFGRNRAPVAAVFDTIDDALAVIGRTAEAERYHTLVRLTAGICPPLVNWMRENPLVVVTEEAVWEQLALVVRWFQEHPHSGVYRRQIDLPGIDTKFIEGRRSLLARLLDAVLQPSAVLDHHPPKDFDERYGLRPKPFRIGIRSLDTVFSFGGLPEVIAPISHVATLTPDIDRVIIVENEITGLAFPAIPRTILIHGLGYGVEVLSAIPWVHTRPVWYWGDIDTHGFSILSRLRGLLPHIRSFLMDEPTLLHHRLQCVDEHPQDFARHRFLNDHEDQMLQHLRQGTFGPRLRLEQERIGWGWATPYIDELVRTSG